MPDLAQFDALREGDEIVSLTLPPVERRHLVDYAGVSGDHNPIHQDDQVARATGLPSVIQHGMLSMAHLGRLVTNWAPQSALVEFSTRFTAMVFPGDVLTCRGVVVAKSTDSGENMVELEITAQKQTGETVLAGKARVALP